MKNGKGNWGDRVEHELMFSSEKVRSSDAWKGFRDAASERKMPVRCPHCSTELKSVVNRCPRCGRELHYGGNTSIYSHAQKNTLTLSEILSDAMRKHSYRELVNSLMRRNEPQRNMLAAWNKPWMFLRVFAFLFLASAVMYAMLPSLFATNLFISMGCMTVPLTLALLIWEMDIPANVSIFDMIVLIFFGGVLSLLFASNLNENISASYWAGCTEEPSKLAVCILFVLISKRRFYGLDGLAIGAAVGAGFAFMESIQYVYKFSSIPLVVSRGIRALSSHVLYAAPAMGMLAYVMNGRPFKPEFLLDKRFLRIFACGVFAHMINNMPFQILPLIDTQWVCISLKDVLKTLFIWMVFLDVVKLGIRQTLSGPGVGAAGHENGQRIRSSAQSCRLCGMSGEYDRRSVVLEAGNTLIFGRDPARCHVCFRNPKISGSHCRIRSLPTGIELCDLSSKNGTYVNGNRLVPNQPVMLHPGDRVSIYKDQFVVRELSCAGKDACNPGRKVS